MWTPVDARFYSPRFPVAIANCGGVGEDATIVRGILEQLGAVVLLHHVGTPGDLLEVLSQGETTAPYLIVCAHGDDNGLVFGEYIPQIDTSMLVAGNMPPSCIAKHVHLPGCVVINEACGAGEEEMATAFMRGGLKAYIGAIWPSPDGTAWPLFVTHFFYKLFREGCSIRDAWREAASYDADSKKYVLYDGERRHKVD
jgi:hypothetical protein